ncbi:MAG: SUMF1/EgtB/PvdO family nonheme iron enzyme [Acidobacteria bacterium]|nr:SUMF1/EgtB/PvdO family nonheme iron enzyme [Acidobacteriota bacterium]
MQGRQVPAPIDWFRRNRQRSNGIFDLLTPDAYYERPIALRHPVVFYEGHLPAFNVNTLIKKGHRRDGVDSRLEGLFARGIDPEDAGAAEHAAAVRWPTREEVRQFAGAADASILEALRRGPLEISGDPVLHRGQAVYTILEHEAMHQETLLYMWHQLPQDRKIAPPEADPDPGSPAEFGPTGVAPPRATVRVRAGTATLGADADDATFGWDNEFRAHSVDVPAFDIDVHDVTNGDYRAFVKAGGYRDQSLWRPRDWNWIQSAGIRHPPFWREENGTWVWRGMFKDVSLPPAWPVYVSHAEACAYARWKRRRLPTEAEYHRAAFGTPSGEERPFPWGAEPPSQRHGNFDFRRWDPVPVGSFPAGASAWGIHDLIGNGWEWTSSIFAPFPGFEPMASYPEYSADFFDGQHYVMKGASPATARELVRRSFRNWFRPHYPYVYATFRTASDV